MVFFTVVREWRADLEQVKLLVLGLDDSGKSTINAKLSGRNLNDIPPTISFKISTINLPGRRINLWDIGGHRSIIPFWQNYYENTDGIIWVLDSTDSPLRLQECAQKVKSLMENEQLKGVPILVLANKQDLQGARSESSIRDIFSLEESNIYKVLKTSAILDLNIDSALRWILNAVSRTKHVAFV